MPRSSLHPAVAVALALIVVQPTAAAKADVTAFFGTPAPCGGAAPVRAPTEVTDDGGSAVIHPVTRPEPPERDGMRGSSEPASSSTGSTVIPDGSGVSPLDVDPGPARVRGDAAPDGVDERATMPASSPAVPLVGESTTPHDPGEVLERAAEPASLPITPERSCAPVEIVRVGDGSNERASLVLVDCEGRDDPASLLELSLLGRPHGEDRPSDAALEAHELDAEWIAPRVRRVEAGLLGRLRAIADRFPGRPIEIISGYRPGARAGSRHRFGRALDLRVRGVDVTSLDAFARTLEATGVGLYPTTEFIHVDVRSRSAHWIDTSGPGEPPSLVRAPAPATEAGDAARSASEREPSEPSTTREPSEPTAGEPSAASEPSEPEPSAPSMAGEPGEPSAASEPLDPAAIGREAAALLDGFALDLHR